MSDLEAIHIPQIIPVMGLTGVVLFPHAVMPLYIFEERYQRMLADVLEQDRLFAVFNRSPGHGDDDAEGELHAVGTVGIVRAAHKNADGTSNLALQGIQRVRLKRQVQEFPYPIIEVEACPLPEDSNSQLQLHSIPEILGFLRGEPGLTECLPEEYLQFLASIEDPNCFLDVAAHSLCEQAIIRQRMLEAPRLADRYAIFAAYLQKEKDRIQLYRQLQGNTREDEIEWN